MRSAGPSAIKSKEKEKDKPSGSSGPRQATLFSMLPKKASKAKDSEADEETQTTDVGMQDEDVDMADSQLERSQSWEETQLAEEDP